VDDLLATKSEDVGLIDRAISFQDFPPMWSWSTNVTDRRTDVHCSAWWKLSGGMLASLSVWDKICIWPSSSHCHSLSLAPGNPD